MLNHATELFEKNKPMLLFLMMKNILQSIWHFRISDEFRVAPLLTHPVLYKTARSKKKLLH